MATFNDAIDYALQNEGGYTDNPADHGGKTAFGVTAEEAASHGYTPGAVTLDQAKTIYQTDYWRFDGVTDQRVATKILDMVINLGMSGGVRVVQRAVGVAVDGVWGPHTEAAVNALDPEKAIEQISYKLADYYIDIVKNNLSQLVFLRGWIRRAIRRP